MAKEEQTSKKDKIEKEGSEEILMTSEERLQKNILDATMNKYDVVVLSRRWAYELQSQEPGGLSIQDAIEMSVNDILGGKVSPKTIKALPPLRHAKKQKGVMGFITEPLAKTDGVPLPDAEGGSEGHPKKDKDED